MPIISKVISPLFQKNYFGFLSISNVLEPKIIEDMRALIYRGSDKIINEFEELFSKKIGSGHATAFASGRMGLYQLLKILKIGKGDEVIINSGTCAVMVNAILHANAKPVFSDVDFYSFGSSPLEIKKNISPNTKMIIAQHSFGIPCKIEAIKNISRKHGIFLLEDCALSLNSEFKGIRVGNFGDAALFSFDHTKPLNLFSGGLIYTNDNKLNDLLTASVKNIQTIPLKKQKAMLSRLLLEQRIQNSSKYKFIKFYDIIQSIKIKIGFNSPYLDENSGLENKNCSYPYPAKMPSFIAKAGIYQLKDLNHLLELRKKNLKIILNELQKTQLKRSIPEVYQDEKLNIIPLRLVLFSNDLKFYKKKIKGFIDIESIWFQKPIISTTIKLNLFGYKNNCPNSEQIGENVINFPLDLSNDFLKNLVTKIKNTLIENKK